MREILFRGKRLDNNEWFYGCYQEYPNNEICIQNEYRDYYFVVSETVGQFTGMLDKNGKKIFEGDIITGRNWLHDDRILYRVVYEENGFYYCDADDVSWHPANIENIEVIGNIHDNPELLEANQI